MFLKNHINLITVQIDVMDEKDTSKTTQLAYVTKIKENLDMNEDMQRNGKTSNQPLTQEVSKSIEASAKTNEREIDSSKADMVSKAVDKKKAMGKLVHLLIPTCLIHLTKGRNLQWETKLGF